MKANDVSDLSPDDEEVAKDVAGLFVLLGQCLRANAAVLKGGLPRDADTQWRILGERVALFVYNSQE